MNVRAAKVEASKLAHGQPSKNSRIDFVNPVDAIRVSNHVKAHQSSTPSKSWRHRAHLLKVRLLNVYVFALLMSLKVRSARHQ